MADDRSTIILPDNSQHPGYMYPAFGGLGNGFGSFNSIADLFGLAIIASMFGWGNNGFGGFGGNWGGGNAAGFLSNQLNNDSGRELIMNAVTSQGEASRTAVQSLATMLGQDFNLVNAGVQNVQNALATIAANQGMNTLQVVNAIQNGNCQLASEFQRCCCENKLLVTSQGYENQLRTVEQTNAINGSIADLKATVIDQFCGLEKREMQAKIDTQSDIIGQLRSQIDNTNQTNQIIGYVNSVVTPLQTKVNEIAAKQLPTVPVVYPNIAAVNNTPYMGNYYGGFNSYGYNFPGGSYWG
jgi:hypothetical protein